MDAVLSFMFRSLCTPYALNRESGGAKRSVWTLCTLSLLLCPRTTGTIPILYTHTHTHIYIYIYIYFLCRCGPTRAMASSFLRFLDHTATHHSVGRTLLNEWSARRRDLYLTTHNTHNIYSWPGGIRTHNLSRRAPADLHLRPRGHWDRHILV